MSYTCQICGMFVSDFAPVHLCPGNRTPTPQGFTNTTVTVTSDLETALLARIAVALERLADALAPEKKGAKKRV